MGSDVKLNGVPVGTVAKISATDDGADLQLALDPATAGQAARQRRRPAAAQDACSASATSPLVPPGSPAAATLQAGDVIHQDASAEAVELEQVFDELLPVLKAIQPEKLSAMLGEFADMLRGQGKDSATRWSSGRLPGEAQPARCPR